MHKNPLALTDLWTPSHPYPHLQHSQPDPIPKHQSSAKNSAVHHPSPINHPRRQSSMGPQAPPTHLPPQLPSQQKRRTCLDYGMCVRMDARNAWDWPAGGCEATGCWEFVGICMDAWWKQLLTHRCCHEFSTGRVYVDRGELDCEGYFDCVCGK